MSSNPCTLPPQEFIRDLEDEEQQAKERAKEEERRAERRRRDAFRTLLRAHA